MGIAISQSFTENPLELRGELYQFIKFSAKLEHSLRESYKREVDQKIE